MSYTVRLDHLHYNKYIGYIVRRSTDFLFALNSPGINVL